MPSVSLGGVLVITLALYAITTIILVLRIKYYKIKYLSVKAKQPLDIEKVTTPTIVVSIKLGSQYDTGAYVASRSARLEPGSDRTFPVLLTLCELQHHNNIIVNQMDISNNCFNTE